MPTNVIVAHDEHLGIGYENQLPWRGKVPADMERFKRLTIGHTVVMGRKTFDSIGRPLPNRENVVISRDRELKIDGVSVVNSLEQALEFRERGKELFIAGGATIYGLAMPHAEKLHITKIRAKFEADSFFVKIDENDWHLKDLVMRGRDKDNEFDMEFMTYDRV